MKYFDAFAGIGGFALGIQRAGDHRQKTDNERGCDKDLSEGIAHTKRNDVERHVSCVGYSEIDKYASSVYQRHFGGHKPYGDITKIKTETIPDFDILVGGFPCQAFSIAGKRGGFEDTRGTLFFELARILADKKPGYFCFENVKGLLSHDKGRTFKTIIETLDELGYDLQWQVLNSKNYGVPQNRERVFIVGNLRDRPRPQVFPFGASDQEDIVLPTITTRITADANGSYVRMGQTQERVNDIKVAGTLDVGGWGKCHESIRRVYDPDGIAPTIPANSGGGEMPKILSPSVSRTDGKRTVTYTESDIAPTIRATQYKSGDNQPKILQTRTPQAEHIQDKVYKPEGISPAVNTFQPHNIDGERIRRLTPLECERLQAFPDHWTQYGKDGELISDSQRYKMCGNAVTVNVVQAIFTQLFTTILEEQKQ